METIQDLFWKLYSAESEEEVCKIVNTNSILNDPKNWKLYGSKQYGENFGNFGTFEGQQYHPIPALVEKITNSIDALLMKECINERIPMKSDKAPKSMSDAVERFFGIKDGDFSEVGSGKRRDIGGNIQIIASGDLKSPSITIYDDGEGQHPDDFEDTFLSLHRKNKSDIRFVQGKYNMGSTGAVTFCGEDKYQLIASKKSIANSELHNDHNPFGFTLVRRHPMSKVEEKEYDYIWYEYFLQNGKIASFNIDEIDLGLWDRKFNTGSIVKLYSYDLPRGSTSDITWDLWRDLNQYLYHPALPILLFEKRYEKRYEKGRTPTKLMMGNKTRITIDDRDKMELIIPFKIEEKNIPIDVIIFKPGDEPKEINRQYLKNKSVVFTQNGQVHGSEGQSFVSQQLGFHLLKALLQVYQKR